MVFKHSAAVLSEMMPPRLSWLYSLLLVPLYAAIFLEHVFKHISHLTKKTHFTAETLLIFKPSYFLSWKLDACFLLEGMQDEWVYCQDFIPAGEGV